jgi:predicted nucleic acid-binding protein
MSDDVFLLDTNIISNSSKTSPNLEIAGWLRSQARVAIPFAAILEMEIGIFQMLPNNTPKAMALGSWLDGILQTEFEYPIPTPEVARLLAEMYCCDRLSYLWFTDPDKPKKRRPGQDLLIAATAISYDMPIATCDEKDFVAIDQRFPLPGVFDPAAGAWLVPRLRRKPESEHRTIMVA